MASQSHLDTCDFAGSQTLVAVGAHAEGSPSGEASYYLPCATPGAEYHLSSSFGSACQRGQRLRVAVSATAQAIDPTDGTVLLHSDSLARVMALLGYRVDAASGFRYLERGYGSEAAANASLEMIWCLEAHCPDSARDWDPDASEADCRAEVHNLAGFVSRKRPIPQLDHAATYYDSALALQPQHCPTLGYLAELHLTNRNMSGAASVATHLCAVCGDASDTARQARVSFEAAQPPVEWPCTTTPQLPPPPSSPPPLPRAIDDDDDDDDDGSADDGSFLSAPAFVGIVICTVVGVSSFVIYLKCVDRCAEGDTFGQGGKDRFGPPRRV